MMRRTGRIAGERAGPGPGTFNAAWNQARAHPFATVLVAVGVGMLVGRVARAVR